jgi:hypothetical protein
MQFSLEPLYLAIPLLSLLRHISFFCSITILVTYTQTLVIPLFFVPSIDVFLLFSIEQLSLAIPPLSPLRHIFPSLFRYIRHRHTNTWYYSIFPALIYLFCYFKWHSSFNFSRAPFLLFLHFLSFDISLSSLYGCIRHRHTNTGYSSIFRHLIYPFLPQIAVLIFFSFTLSCYSFTFPPSTYLFPSFYRYIRHRQTNTLALPLFSLRWSIFVIPSIAVFRFYSLEPLYLAIPPLSFLRHISFLRSIAIFATSIFPPSMYFFPSVHHCSLLHVTEILAKYLYFSLLF